MKTSSDFLSIAALIVMFAYISFNEIRHKSEPATVFSDESVAELQYEREDGPFPAISLDVPEQMTFAGEPVPLNITDVHERLDKELQINTYFHSNTLFLIKRANRWLPQIEKILKENDVPNDFKYLPLIESNLLNDVSPKNAVGYWQILKSAGKENGLEITDEVDERYDPLKATEAACKYLKRAYRKFGNWTLVAASYNRGMGGVERAIENQSVDNYYDLFLNDETARYVFRILAIKEIVEHPLKYGFRVNPKHLYQEEPMRYVDVDETIKDLVTFAKQHNTNYKLIKRHNPWLRDDKLTVRKGKQYRIAIPENSN
ncbi:MAG: lytic transglycosylase domain-containing protein [Bacteroidota bacterium]|nr:lytic transglycosylase domain-containing protein [Bacteroidota bacterium]